jgi:hypothetical protein
MAKPKRKLTINKHTDTMFWVYYIDIPIAIQAISTIEGVIYVGIEGAAIDVLINPLYDIDDIIEEIESLLLTEVPDAFR